MMHQRIIHHDQVGFILSYTRLVQRWINRAQHTNKLMNKGHVVIARGTQKICDKVQPPFVIRSCQLKARCGGTNPSSMDLGGRGKQIPVNQGQPGLHG